MTHRVGQILTAVTLCAACGVAPTDTPPASNHLDQSGAIVFTSREISAESTECADDSARCARVTVQNIATSGGGTEAVRDNIDLFLIHHLISRLRSFVPEEVGNRFTDAEKLIAAFLGEHRAFVAEFPDATALWTIEMTTEALYNTTEVSTISVSETAFTGGAHPNSLRRLVSFDIATGQLLGVDDLTTDVPELTARAVKALRSARGLEPDADLGAAGFWLEGEDLPIPDNIGVVADGILIHWDPYVIAPYSMGPIEIVISTEKLDGIIDARYWAS